MYIHTKKSVLTNICIIFVSAQLLASPSVSNALNLGQGVIDVVRGKKSEDAGGLKDAGQGTVDVVRGKKSDQAKNVINKGQGVIDVLRGKKSDQAQDMKKDLKQGVKDAGYFIDENKEAIALAAIVATAGWAACATGCDILLGIGDAAIKIGSIDAATAGALVGGAVGQTATSDAGQETAGKSSKNDRGNMDEPDDHDPSKKPVVDGQFTKPYFDPDKIVWSHGRLLAAEGGGAKSDVDTHSDAIIDNILELAKGDTPWSAVIDVTLNPSIAAAPVWNEDMEVAKRLELIVDQATMGEKWNIQLVDYKSIQMPTDEPVFNPVEKDIRVSMAPITLREKIDLLSGTVGGLIGLESGEVEKRVRDGIRTDVRNISDRAQNPPEITGN